MHWRVRAYVEHILAPSLSAGQIVVLDNLSVHKGVRVRQLIKARGCELLFLPAYSPDYSPIEETFSKVKAFLRGVNSCPHLLTNLDTGRFSRPGKVRRASVPSSFQHVIFPGVASQTNQAGTSPLPARNSPTTLHVCSLAYGPGLPSSGCPSSRLLPPGRWPDRA